jgi:signal transduction histidine kinase
MTWLIIFSLVTAITLVLITTPLNAVMLSLPFSAGYWFFGAFARALANAEDARNESQRLLTELQSAHEQLQDYAARVEQLAISEERNRLAREMHDTLGHRLTVAAVQLEGAQRLIERDPGRAAGMVETVRAQVREALAELRATVATMREPFETELSLAVSLQRLAESFDQATDLELHIDLPEEICPLPNAYRLAFYRAAQEALTNVQRHAQAQNVWISLSQTGDQIVLQVSDDGAGFSDEVKETAFGLRGMRERVSHLGGTLSIENRPGGGAQLRIQLPKPEEANHEKD